MDPQAHRPSHIARSERQSSDDDDDEPRSRKQLASIMRLQLAKERHAALRNASPATRTRTSSVEKEAVAPQTPKEAKLDPSTHKTHVKASKSAFTNPSSVTALAEQLQSLRHQDSSSELKNEDRKPRRDAHEQAEDVAISNPNHAKSSSPLLRSALLKIGSNEKDDLLVHLLQQVAFCRTQLDEVAALGETIAAQLVHQQHELRLKHREQTESLEKQLHEAVHFHPRIATLEAKIEELEERNLDQDKKLHFAVQKLQRSRKREKELKMMQDPLWDI